MHARSWTVPLRVLFFCLLAASPAWATGRRTRQGTVLVAGQRGGAPPVLYVAARLSTLVDFEDLLEPAALLTPELRERVGVVAVGTRSLVLVPLRELAEGERLLVPVTGRTEAGEPRTLTLALVTRRDEVDLQARVSFGARAPEARVEPVGAVAEMLLASHGPGTRPRLALVTPGDTWGSKQSDGLRARVDSVFRMDQRLFVTVSVGTIRVNSMPWWLVRARMEPGCEASRVGEESSLPLLVTTEAFGGPWQRYVFSSQVPAGVGCVALTMEEDGPRVLRFEHVRILP